MFIYLEEDEEILKLICLWWCIMFVEGGYLRSKGEYGFELGIVWGMVWFNFDYVFGGGYDIVCVVWECGSYLFYVVCFGWDSG